MEQLLTSIQDLVTKYGAEALLSVVSFAVGTLIGRWRAWRRWTERSFFDRVNVSLNFVEGGELKIRTLLEESSVQVFRNAEMVRQVTNAARSGEGPLLDLPLEDYWYYLNAVLNVVSARFAEGFVRQEAGQAGVVAHKYLLFLTCENDGPVRQRKVRAMLIREELLTAAPTTEPRCLNPFHQARWNTLQAVAEEYASSGGDTPRIRNISLPA